MPLAPGSYDVEAVNAQGQTVSSQDITIGSTNAEADFNLRTPTTAATRYTPPAPAPIDRPAIVRPSFQAAALIVRPSIQAPAPAAPVNPLTFITTWTHTGPLP